MLEGWLGEGAQELIQGILEEAESGTPATAVLARQSVSADLRGIEGGGAPPASPCRGPAKRGPKG